MLTVITNCTIYTGQHILTGKSILVQGSVIKLIINDSSKEEVVGMYGQDVRIVDLQGRNISCGLIDIQINGGRHRYFSESPSLEALEDMYQACCDYGTPYILPTVISSPLENILKAIDSIRQFRQLHPGVLGMHLQGPYFSDKKRGAHSLTQIRKPTTQQLQQIIQKGKDIIKVITIAPECFTDQQLDLLLSSGINISLGHTDLTYNQTQKYLQKGINLVTHLYNAMTQMGQRECGTVGAVFDNEQVYASIILDGGHCHYAAARIAKKQKADKLILITDSSFLGREKTEFNWQNWSIKMVDGFYRDKDGNLAGAAISMPEAVKNAVENLGISLNEAIQMATVRVAKSIKMQDSIGYIKQSYPAKFFIFDDKLQKYQTMIL